MSVDNDRGRGRGKEDHVYGNRSCTDRIAWRIPGKPSGDADRIARLFDDRDHFHKAAA